MSDDIQEYRGKHIIVRFEPRKCIHSRNCVLGNPDVFEPNTDGPWIHPDHAPVETVAAIARECPSGAITYERIDGYDQESPPVVNVARVRENGPIAIVADARIAGTSGVMRAALCRCGASKRKPYCDGSHAKAGFQATGEPPAQESPQLEIRSGPVKLEPSRDGPLLVDGNIEVCTGTGRTILRASKAFLCRCGASANKPFCDGSHKKVDFKAE